MQRQRVFKARPEAGSVRVLCRYRLLRLVTNSGSQCSADAVFKRHAWFVLNLMVSGKGDG
jgi:hypothetical protein